MRSSSGGSPRCVGASLILPTFAGEVVAGQSAHVNPALDKLNRCKNLQSEAEPRPLIMALLSFPRKPMIESDQWYGKNIHATKRMGGLLCKCAGHAVQKGNATLLRRSPVCSRQPE